MPDDISNSTRERMPDMSTKREEELNDMAKRLGLMLIKSRAKRRTPHDHRQYRIVDINNVVQAGENFDMSLNDVEKFLKDREGKPANI